MVGKALVVGLSDPSFIRNYSACIIPEQIEFPVAQENLLHVRDWMNCETIYTQDLG